MKLITLVIFLLSLWNAYRAVRDGKEIDKQIKKFDK